MIPESVLSFSFSALTPGNSSCLFSHQLESWWGLSSWQRTSLKRSKVSNESLFRGTICKHHNFTAIASKQVYQDRKVCINNLFHIFLTSIIFFFLFYLATLLSLTVYRKNSVTYLYWEHINQQMEPKCTGQTGRRELNKKRTWILKSWKLKICKIPNPQIEEIKGLQQNSRNPRT